MNGTNQTIRFKRGCSVGRVREAGIVSSIELANRDNYRISDKELEDVTVPKEFGRDLMPLLRKRWASIRSPPPKKAPYRTPLKQRALVDQAIDEMLEAGIIEKLRSPWDFAIVLVEKKEGSKRFCVDFRALNKVTKSNAYPLPVIEDILAFLGMAKYFSKLDLKSGYWQVELDDKDKEKAAFVSHRGIFFILTLCHLGLQMRPLSSQR